MRIRDLMTRIRAYPDGEDFEILEIRATAENGYFMVFSNNYQDKIIIEDWKDLASPDAEVKVEPEKKGLFQKKKKEAKK